MSEKGFRKIPANGSTTVAGNVRFYVRFLRHDVVAALTNKRLNAGKLSYIETDKYAVYIYNREQVQKPRYDWTAEISPVTKVTRHIVSPASCRQVRKENPKRLGK